MKIKNNKFKLVIDHPSSHVPTEKSWDRPRSSISAHDARLRFAPVLFVRSVRRQLKGNRYIQLLNGCTECLEGSLPPFALNLLFLIFILKFLNLRLFFINSIVSWYRILPSLVKPVWLPFTSTVVQVRTLIGPTYLMHLIWFSSLFCCQI